MLVKIIIITHGLSNTQFSIEIFKELMDVKTITQSPHMEEFIIEAATKKRLFWIREHYFAKFHETSYNGCFQDNGYKWIKWDN